MGTGFNDRISNYIKDIAIFYIYIKLNPTKEECRQNEIEFVIQKYLLK